MRTEWFLVAGAAVVAAGWAGALRGPRGFGEGLTPLDAEQMAGSKGGVLATLIQPSPSQTHLEDNPRLSGTVYNHQGETQTTLHIHHGTIKTGQRVVATPAPNYSGSVDTRFTMRGGADDLVLKYYYLGNGTVLNASTIPDQSLDTRVKLFRVRVWNLNGANVPGSIISSMLDNQDPVRPPGTTPSVDALLASCPDDQQVQFQMTGLDYTATLPRLQFDVCDDFHQHMWVNQGGHLPSFDIDGSRCMANISGAIRAFDPNGDYIHVVVAEQLSSGLNGFDHPSYPFSVVREGRLTEPGWRQPLTFLHEIGHDAGAPAYGSAQAPHCNSSDPMQRDVMCEGGAAGRHLGSATCASLYTLDDHYRDFNDGNP